jgi:thiol-disulfide isomerase/thioredoxin
MRTFFATCGALALMIPVGLLQSENTNAQDGSRQGNRRTLQTFSRVQRYNDGSSRQAPPRNISRCGTDNCGEADCDSGMSTSGDCRSGNCGRSGCSTCQMTRRDPCDSSVRTGRPRGTLRGQQRELLFDDRRVPSSRQWLDAPTRDRESEPRNLRRSGGVTELRRDDRAVPDGAPRSDVTDRGPVQSLGIQWRTDIQAASRESSETGLPILMKFSAKWCGPCKRMKSETFTDPRLAEMINTCFIPVEVDTDQNGQLARQLRIESVPTTMVISPQGDIVERREGFQSATQLTGAIARFCRQPPEQPIVRNEPRSRFGR